jgi:hypothetical protein
MNTLTGGLEDWLYFVEMITAKAPMKNSDTAVEEFMISLVGWLGQCATPWPKGVASPKWPIFKFLLFIFENNNFFNFLILF